MKWNVVIWLRNYKHIELKYLQSIQFVDELGELNTITEFSDFRKCDYKYVFTSNDGSFSINGSDIRYLDFIKS